MVLKIYIRDKKGDIFLNHRDLSEGVSTLIGDHMSDFVQSKPRHSFLKLNKVCPSEHKYVNGFKIEKHVGKKNDFNFKNVKKLDKKVRKFIKKMKKNLSDNHPIIDLLKLPDYILFIDQKKDKVIKNFNVLTSESFNRIVEERAKDIYEENGSQEGKDLENWNEAQKEIKKEYKLV